MENQTTLPMTRTTRPEGTLAVVEADRAVAEVQAAMTVAKRFPRDPLQSEDRILNECQRQGLAEVAVYEYSRGGSAISGPSIRLAEMLARNWGNIQYGIRELEQRAGESVVQAYAWDQESNTRREIVFTVPHTRDTKRGRVRLEDARDIYETVANMGSRRLRSCILGVLPGDIVDAAVAQCEETLKAKADIGPEGLKRLVEAFARLGITREQVETRIQRRLEAIQPAQVVSLRRIHASLKDGMSQPKDWFEMPEQQPSVEQQQVRGAEALKQKLRGAPQQQPAGAPLAQQSEPSQVEEDFDPNADIPDL